MEKFLCVQCTKHYGEDTDLFIYGQYCTGFCSLLHYQNLKAEKKLVVSNRVVVKKKTESEAA